MGSNFAKSINNINNKSYNSNSTAKKHFNRLTMAQDTL